MIVTVRSATGMSVEQAVARVLSARKRPLPERVAKVEPVTAYINHGRWVADCSFCPGSELVDPTNRRFFCLSCLNEGAEGQWVVVKFPRNRAVIEGALVGRYGVENRNWKPGETLAQIQVETVVHQGGAS